VSADISSGGKVFGSKIVDIFPISDYAKALDVREKMASDGKIILKPFV